MTSTSEPRVKLSPSDFRRKSRRLKKRLRKAPFRQWAAPLERVVSDGVVVNGDWRVGLPPKILATFDGERGREKRFPLPDLVLTGTSNKNVKKSSFALTSLA